MTCPVLVRKLPWLWQITGRVLTIDIETCPERGGKLRVIADIEDPPPIANILGHVQRRDALVRLPGGEISRGPNQTRAFRGGLNPSGPSYDTCSNQATCC